MIISSATNERIKNAVALRSRRQRARTGLILVEGETEISRALAAGLAPESLFVPVGSHPRLSSACRRLGGTVVEVEGPALDRLAVRGASSPVMVAERAPTGLDALPTPGEQSALYLVVEAIEKPGNLGAMIRTADGAGIDGLVVADPTVDPFGPNVIRASLGSVFSMPTAVATSSDTIDWLQRRHVTIVVTTPGATVEWTQADLTGSVACVIGAEHQGLSAAWLEVADQSVFLPMHGVGDSLNAAATAAIILYEAVRQRSR